jgi:NAD(P)-dependent dehydrogenase (short-subunit alcohol dehydrogenase family)
MIGGGSGIGLACARRAVSEHARVFLVGRRSARLAQASRALGGAAPAAYAVADACSASDMRRAVAEAVDTLGGLDAVVVCAGSFAAAPLEELDTAGFRALHESNVLPVFHAAQAAVPHLRAAGGGALVAMASLWALVGRRQGFAYAAAKAAIVGMVRSLALDLAASRIRVNAVCPGYVETDQALDRLASAADPQAERLARISTYPLQRGGRPEEVAALVAHLVSDDAAWTTGQALAIDGGYSAA